MYIQFPSQVPEKKFTSVANEINTFQFLYKLKKYISLITDDLRRGN